MKTYPSIRYFTQDDLGKQITAYQKFDGSNLRAEWNKKKGFYKFGSRHQLISEQDSPLGEAIQLIKNHDKLGGELLATKAESAVLFFEFWGEHSKFGSHQKEQHHCTLIDVSLYRKGYMLAEEFINTFSKIATVLYQGFLTEEFIQSVKDGTLPGLGSEGVVCKGAVDKTGLPFMCKVKRNSWFEELKKFCSGDEKKYKELA